MGIENGIRMVTSARSPFPSVGVKSATFTLGAEASNARNIEIQFKTPRSLAASNRVAVRAFLAQDSLGTLLSQTSPDSILAGAAGNVNVGTGNDGLGLTAISTLAIDASAAKFKTTSTATFLIGGKTLTKVATTARVFTAAHVVTASLFGVILVQIDSAGTISTKVPSATQAYASAALALRALPVPDQNCVSLGYITIAAGGGGFVANTTDLTTIAAFVDTAVLTASRQFTILPNAAGLANVIIATTLVVTYYLVLILPDGSLQVSNAIAFV